MIYRILSVVLAVGLGACSQELNERSEVSHEVEPYQPAATPVPVAAPSGRFDPHVEDSAPGIDFPKIISSLKFFQDSDIRLPPLSYYRSILESALLKRQQGSLALLAETESTPVLWVNFAGATLKKGVEAGETFIPCDDEIEFPAAELTADQEARIISDVQSYYDASGVALNVTGQQPTERPYTTVHVGGEYNDLNCEEQEGIAGIAPYDRGNFNGNDIGFVFPAVFEDDDENRIKKIGDVVAHEGGHTYGLNHIGDETALMNPYVSVDADAFKKGPADFLFVKYEQDAPRILKSALAEADPLSNCDRIAKLISFINYNFNTSFELPGSCGA